MAWKLDCSRCSQSRGMCPLSEAVEVPNTKAVEQGSKASDHLIESFAEKLAKAFAEGELIVGNWSPDEGAEIKVIPIPPVRSPRNQLKFYVSHS